MQLYTMSNLPDWNRIVNLKTGNSKDCLDYLNDSSRCKMLLITEGCGNLLCNDESYNFVAPHLFCFNEHDSVNFSGNNCRFWFLFFHPTVLNDTLSFELFQQRATLQKSVSQTVYQDALLLNPFFGVNCRESKSLPLNHQTAEQLKNILSSINSELVEQTDKFWPCRSRSFFIECLFCLNRLTNSQILRTDIVKSEETEVENIIAYFHEIIGQRISLPEILKKFACNRNQLNEHFVAATGYTAMQYLNNLRMDFAASLLIHTALPLDEIAERSGFSEYSYFSKCFKKNYADSPKMFREKARLAKKQTVPKAE